MSGKSKESAKAVDRPFAPRVWKEAERIAEAYQIILHCEDGHWYGRGLELPHVFGDGKTVDQCMEDTREALCGAVACMIEQGQRPPAAARAGTRTQQVNVRLTAEEKAMLETTAKRKGFNGLSDFIRAAAMESVK
jgi:predicted RNase H-like HicB family nuclease